MVQTERCFSFKKKNYHIKKPIDIIIKYGLNDSHDVVRFNAVISLGKSGSKKVFKSLIDRLNKKEKAQNIRKHIAAILREFSKKDYDDDYEKWEKWYNETKNK